MIDSLTHLLTMQWLQTLFTTGPRFKAGDERKAYALDKPEPLVCFALCCGGRSDPAVRNLPTNSKKLVMELSLSEFSASRRREAILARPEFRLWIMLAGDLVSSNFQCILIGLVNRFEFTLLNTFAKSWRLPRESIFRQVLESELEAEFFCPGFWSGIQGRSPSHLPTCWSG